MTEVPIESVALKLFTGIEKFEIMAIPFFILAGNFLTHGGGQTHDRVCNVHGGLLAWWPRVGRCVGLCLVFRLQSLVASARVGG